MWNAPLDRIIPKGNSRHGSWHLDVPAQRLPVVLDREHAVRAPVEEAAGELALRQHGVGGEDAPGDAGQRVDQRDDDADLVRPLPLAAVTRVRNGFS